MEKLVGLLLKLYPLDNVSVQRRVKIHLLFWLIWGIIIYFSILSGKSLQYRLLVSFTAIFHSAMIYYTLSYYIFTNDIGDKKLILVIKLLLFYLLNWGFNYLSYSLILYLNVDFNHTNLSEYASKYVTDGYKRLFNGKDLAFEIFVLLQGTAPAFILKAGRLMANYNQRSIKLEKEKTEIELHLLRLQLNPHFLLNTLNNIYSQVISKQENAPHAILTLSELLNYILYEANSETVPLKQEIKFLRDYIDLEKIRNNASLKISFEIEGSLTYFSIAPLILISFVENAFKHGIGDSTLQSSIDIRIRVDNETGEFNFFIKNTKPRLSGLQQKIRQGGIGIINTQKRLEKLYAGKHKLVIENEINSFSVNLSMILNRTNGNMGKK